MTRVRTATLLTAVAALLAVFAALVPGMAAPARAADSAPLTVTISGLSPSVIPAKGRITITGTVRNTTKQTWRGIHVYPLTSYDPITSDSDLSEAAASDPTTVIGNRMVELRRKVGTLRPGASAHFRIRVPVAELSISRQPGVYWLAVHALGSNSAGADEVADGRARTFIPLMRKQVKTTAPVSLVLPVTNAVQRSAGGSVANAKALTRATAPGGQLDRLLEFSRSAGSVPITWLIDPAVLDAVDEITDGNEGIDLAKAEESSPSPSPDSSTSSGPEPDATGSGSPAEDTTSPASESAETAGNGSSGGSGGGAFGEAKKQLKKWVDSPELGRNAAKQWMRGWTDEAKVDTVLAEPYGAPDLSAIASDQKGLLRHAWKLTNRVLKDRDVSARHAVAPAGGYLRPEAAGLLKKHTTVLLQDHGIAHQAIHAKGVRYVYADSSTATGGPGPGDRTSPLQLRQRILAEAALNVLGGRTDPLVVVFPDDWRAGSGNADTRFFRGLDVPWLTPTSLPTGTKEDANHKATSVRLDWPKKAASAVVPALNVDAATQLSRLATGTAGLFSDDDDAIPRGLRKVALAATSDHVRDEPVAARITVDDADRRMHELLDNIEVQGTDFVVLSGGSGALTVSVHNGLDKPIRIELRSRTDDPLVAFDAPSAIKLGAGSSATVRLHAHADAVGVHEVTLTAATANGAPVGRPLVFSVRTSQIGRVFWMVLAGGMVVLVLLIARRVRQRIRARRAAS